MEKLTDLNYGELNNTDSRWVSFKDGLDVNIEFDQLTQVEEVRLNILRFTVRAIYPPEVIEVFGSKDGKQFKKLGELDQTAIIHIQGRNKIPTTISFTPVRVKILRIKGMAVTPIPEGHQAAGRKPTIRVDEIVVN